MKKSTIIGLVSFLAVASVGAYFYFKSKQKKEDKYIGEVIDKIEEGSFTINIKK